MTTTPQAPAIHRRFRFGLRTLLVVVTLAAVASWVYWVAWPWWSNYREQLRFEQSVGQLKIGSTSEDVYEHLKENSLSALFGNDDENNIIRVRRYELPQADYLIYLVLPKKTLDPAGNLDKSPCSSVEVVRVKTAIYRTAYRHQHGLAQCLREMLAQEGSVMSRAGCTAPVLDADDLAYTREVLAPFLDSQDMRTCMECLFGDAAGQTLGFTPRGLSPWAGLALALNDAKNNSSSPAIQPAPASNTN